MKKQALLMQQPQQAGTNSNITSNTGFSGRLTVQFSVENYSLLVAQAKSLYVNGIKRFPEYNSLRLDFASFLLTKMHNKKEALRELMQVEREDPSLVEQFLIFRYRHIIEEDLQQGSEAGGGGGLEFVAFMNYDANYKLLKQAIEKSTLLHLEFWNYLMDDQNDLVKINDQGTRISQSIQAVEAQWKNMNVLGINTQKTIKLYASYLIEVLHDKELGNEHLAKQKDNMMLRNN